MKKITKISKISLFAGLIYFLSFNQVFGQDNLKGITTQAEYITANPLPNTISAKAGQEFQGNIDEKYKEQERVKYKEIEAQIEKAIEQRYKDAISNGQGNNAQTECTTYINGVCEQDYDALVALYNSTNGPNWSNNTNWLVAGQPVSAWYGIQVQNGRVWSIQLQSNGLNGTLPIEIGNLTNLKYLWLQGNQLSGLLPVELGNLSLLQEMWLGNNSFSGQIPVSIGNLTHLTRLSLSRNQLTGTIPLQLGNLFNLLTIDFSGNRLTGNIPAELGNLTNLIYVFLRENQLSGQIPLTFSSLTYLNVLDLQFNQLSGSIPTFITNFNNLQRLILRNNQLTGTIPAELGNLNNLEELNLAWNQLTGNIPAELGNLTSLQWLQLGINQLSGNIPPELGNLITLRFLNLNNNQLTGPVPSSFANLVSIETIYLRNNSFSFLPNLSALPNLYWYAVDLNKLDFDDIETNIRSGIDFIYAPQDSIGQLLNMNVLQGTSLTLTVTVGGANNSYQWTKNGVDIPGATDPIYTIASATSQDQGSYRCRITNTVATQLTLYSRVNSVTVPAPPCPGIPTVTYEGKTYNTVQIGTQCWLKENLNVGTKINGHDNQIDNGILEKYCYDDLESNCDIYGGLYQWNEMMQYVALEGTKGICPTGWHIPSDAEWCTITNLLDPTVNCNAWGYSGTEVAMKMKEPGLTHWCPPNTGANNSSGFTALPSGSLRNMEGFYFYGKMGTAFFWSSSQTYFFNGGGWGRLFSSDQTGITRTNIGGQSQGFSVRCIKDPCTSYSDVGVNIESSSNPVCEGSSVTFTATPINGGTEPVYQWQINGVNSGTNQSDFTYNPVNNDVVICILTSNASCINGNQATSNPVTMTVEPILPVDVVISASANQICAGTSVEFTAISTNGGTTPSFQWNVNGSPAGLNNPVFTYEPINTDVVTCVLTTSLNCTTGNPAISNAIIMTVNPELPVGIIIAASANPVCNNTSVTFTATPINGGAAPSYQWKVNGTNVGTSAATYSYTPANSDVVTCELTSNITPCATGNPATSNTLNMTVNPLPNATITVTPSNNIYTGGDPTRIYLGYGPQSVTLHASETGGTGFFYSWTSPTALGLAGLSCTNCANPVFSQTVEGRYILNLTITNSAGCSSSSSITICVMDIRVPNQNNKVYICHNQGNQQTLAVSVNAVPAHVPGHPGDFLGKCNQSCDNIAFKSDELAGDLIVSPDNSLSTIVYPNPFRSDFTLIVETESEEIIEANIYDLTGRLLQVIKDLKPNVPVIITNDLTDGFYILHISQGGHSQKVKIVKNR